MRTCVVNKQFTLIRKSNVFTWDKKGTQAKHPIQEGLILIKLIVSDLIKLDW